MSQRDTTRIQHYMFAHRVMPAIFYGDPAMFTRHLAQDKGNFLRFYWDKLTERIDKPQTLFSPGQEIEAEVTAIDARDRKIALSIKALRKSEEREEIETYLQREREGGRFSFEDILRSDLRLDRDEPGTAKRENDEPK